MDKPKELYHGSIDGTIEEFEPRISTGSGERFGAQVYATPNLGTAVMFTAKLKNKSFAGHFGDIPYVIIRQTREDFIAEDKGGYVYVFSSDTFEPNPGRGGFGGKLEWASPVSVKPIRKIRIQSSLDAMIEHGVQVYFVDGKTYMELCGMPDGSTKLPLLRTLESENQRRGVNVKEL